MDLPKTLLFDGKPKRIKTDFRDWMKFYSLLIDNELTDCEKLNAAILLIFNAIPADADQAMTDCIWFYRCGEEIRGEPARERLLDWKKDYMAIWADFKLYYRMDINKIKYLHWWEFSSMFVSLPGDAEIKRRIKIRAIDLSKIKDTELRNEYQKQKEIFTLDSFVDDWDSFYKSIID